MAFLEPIFVTTASSLITKLIEKIANSSFYISPTIVSKQRQKLGDNFYEPHYQYAISVNSSGLSLGKTIQYISQIKTGMTTLPKKHLVNNLKKRDLHVCLLLINPYSSFVDERMASEHNPRLREDILNNIERLKELKRYLANLPSQDRTIQGSLEVRLLNDRLPFCTLTLNLNHCIRLQ